MAGGNGNGNGAHPPEEPEAAPILRGWVPGPGFQRRPTPGLRPDERRRRLRLRRRLFVAAGACVAVAFVVAFTGSVPSVSPTIDDEGFVTAAEAVCEPVRVRLAETEEPEDEPTDEQRAEAIEGRVDALAEMVERLDGLDATAAAEPEVDAWLEAWRAVLASGRATAAARRDGDDEGAAAASAAGVGSIARVNRFAAVNGIRACTVGF